MCKMKGEPLSVKKHTSRSESSMNPYLRKVVLAEAYLVTKYFLKFSGQATVTCDLISSDLHCLNSV